jgi:nucleoside-diphosphate-sugar epimerase
MKYFITGATGFVGGYVTRQLIEAGHSVIAAVRSPADANLVIILAHWKRASDQHLNTNSKSLNNKKSPML